MCGRLALGIEVRIRGGLRGAAGKHEGGTCGAEAAEPARLVTLSICLELLPGRVPLARRRPFAAPYEACHGSCSPIFSFSRTRTHTGLRSTWPGPRGWSSLPASPLNRTASVRPDFLGRAPAASGISASRLEGGASPKPWPQPPRAAEGTHTQSQREAPTGQRQPEPCCCHRVSHSVSGVTQSVTESQPLTYEQTSRGAGNGG